MGVTSNTNKNSNNNEMKELKDIKILVATEEHVKYVDDINDAIDIASKQRGTGIARRTFEYISGKMTEGKAIIALDGDKFVGFCYIEAWQEKGFVANSGLIVVDEYRGIGLAKEIKRKAFNLSRQKYPNSKIFGLTTGLAVMKINHELGYRPVTFSELTMDDQFWNGCKSCVNYDILVRTGRSKCLCTGMLYDPAWEKTTKEAEPAIKKRSLMDIIKKLNPTKISLKNNKEDKNSNNKKVISRIFSSFF